MEHGGVVFARDILSQHTHTRTHKHTRTLKGLLKTHEVYQVEVLCHSVEDAGNDGAEKVCSWWQLDFHGGSGGGVVVVCTPLVVLVEVALSHRAATVCMCAFRAL